MTTSGIENSAPQQQPAGANDQSGTASRKTREALDGSAESPGQPSRESAKVSIQSELGAVVRRVLASMPGKSSQSINLAAVKSQAREIVNEMSRQPGASPSKIRQLHAAIDQLERGDIERILDEGAQAKGEGPEVSDEDADSSGVVRTQDNTNNVVRISNSKTMYISSGAGSHDTYKFSASALQEGDVKVVYGTGADSKVHLPNDIEIVDSYFLTGKDQSNRWFRVVYKDATGSERRIDIEAPAGFKTENVVKENGETITRDTVQVTDRNTVHISSRSGPKDRYEFSEDSLNGSRVKVIYGAGSDSKITLPANLKIVSSEFLTGTSDTGGWYRIVYTDSNNQIGRIDIEAASGFSSSNVLQTNEEKLSTKASSRDTKPQSENGRRGNHVSTNQPRLGNSNPKDEETNRQDNKQTLGSEQESTVSAKTDDSSGAGTKSDDTVSQKRPQNSESTMQSESPVGGDDGEDTSVNSHGGDGQNLRQKPETAPQEPTLSDEQEDEVEGGESDDTTGQKTPEKSASVKQNEPSAGDEGGDDAGATSAPTDRPDKQESEPAQQGSASPDEEETEDTEEVEAGKDDSDGEKGTLTSEPQEQSEPSSDDGGDSEPDDEKDGNSDPEETYSPQEWRDFRRRNRESRTRFANMY